MARLLQQFREALEILRVCRTPPALIGGLALVAHQVVRATQDVDFLVDAGDAEALHAALLEHGYRCIHRSEDAANYARGSERLDVLFAHRPRARQLLAGATPAETAAGRVPVVSVEGLVTLEPPAPLFGPAIPRPQPSVHTDPFADFAELMELVEALCPEWPARGPMRGSDFRM